MVNKYNRGLSSQNYPRIQNEDSKFFGYLDDSRLQPHIYKPTEKELKEIIIAAIKQANRKSSRAILDIPDGTPENQLKSIYQKGGKELFKYFLKYCGDPASTAYACIGKHYSVIGKEQFRNRALQKGRMNSGWRYQYIAKGAAIATKRFVTVSDIGLNEADFSATIAVKNFESDLLNIYVSVKNRVNTISGGSWPKSIRALEEVAKNDKNRTGPYICVFGIAMQKGNRTIKAEQKKKTPYSFNTEVWLSDFFWPFFTNYSYEEIAKAVLSVLPEIGEQDNTDIEIHPELLDSFGECCKNNGLLDNEGYFNDAFRLVELFVRANTK